MLATATAYRGASSLKDKELCRVFPVLGHPAPLPDTLKPKPDTLNRISCWGVPVFRAACRPCSPRSPCSPSFSSYVFFFRSCGAGVGVFCQDFQGCCQSWYVPVPVAALGLWIRFSSFLPCLAGLVLADSMGTAEVRLLSASVFLSYLPISV